MCLFIYFAKLSLLISDTKEFDLPASNDDKDR
jgi:hypothetical protein